MSKPSRVIATAGTLRIQGAPQDLKAPVMALVNEEPGEWTPRLLAQHFQVPLAVMRKAVYALAESGAIGPRRYALIAPAAYAVRIEKLAAADMSLPKARRRSAAELAVDAARCECGFIVREGANAVDLPAPTSAIVRIFQVLATKGPLTYSNLCKALGIDPQEPQGSLSRALTQLEDGICIFPPDGLWPPGPVSPPKESAP